MDEIDIRYTDKPITPFGGLTTVKRFYDWSGLQEVIKRLPLPQSGSNLGYDAVDLVEGFIVSVLLGSHRLSHSGINSKHDPTHATLKIHCIAIAAFLFNYGKQTTLFLSVSEGRRLFFENLLKELEKITHKMTFSLKRKFLMNSSGK